MQRNATIPDDILADAPPPRLTGEPTDRDRRGTLNRLAQWAAAGVVSGWVPIHTVAAQAQSAISPPAGFPATPALYRQAFRNWSGEIAVKNVWTAAPATADEVLAVVNWAHKAGWQVRAVGRRHNWSPLTLARGQSPERVILLDTTKHLTAWRTEPGSADAPLQITAQTGITMEALQEQMNVLRLCFSACPDAGGLTLGGVLAIGGHGTGVQMPGRQRRSGDTFGSLSNRVQALNAVVFDTTQNRYVVRRFSRTDPDIAPLLTHLGRAFIIDVTLQVSLTEMLRCRTLSHLSFEEVFAAPGSSGSTLATLVEQEGRVEVAWLPFTDRPVVRLWRPAPTRPREARFVAAPYNYDRAGPAPDELVRLARRITVGGEGALTPHFCDRLGQVLWQGVVDNNAQDLWGYPHAVLQYVRPDILPLTGNGYAILTRRSELQRIVRDVRQVTTELIQRYRAQDMFPINGRIGLRVTGLDQPADAGAGAVAPALSALAPRPDRPEWDVAVWVDMLSLPGTRQSAPFLREVEERFFALFNGVTRDATVRPEWSKGWAYTDAGPWQHATMLAGTLPNLFNEGRLASAGWRAAMTTLDRLDPGRVFSSPLLDRLMPRT